MSRAWIVGFDDGTVGAAVDVGLAAVAESVEEPGAGRDGPLVVEGLAAVVDVRVVDGVVVVGTRVRPVSDGRDRVEVGFNRPTPLDLDESSPEEAATPITTTSATTPVLNASAIGRRCRPRHGGEASSGTGMGPLGRWPAGETGRGRAICELSELRNVNLRWLRPRRDRYSRSWTFALRAGLVGASRLWSDATVHLTFTSRTQGLHRITPVPDSTEPIQCSCQAVEGLGYRARTCLGSVRPRRVLKSWDSRLTR